MMRVSTDCRSNCPPTLAVFTLKLLGVLVSGRWFERSKPSQAKITLCLLNCLMDGHWPTSCLLQFLLLAPVSIYAQPSSLTKSSFATWFKLKAFLWLKWILNSDVDHIMWCQHYIVWSSWFWLFWLSNHQFHLFQTWSSPCLCSQQGLLPPKTHTVALMAGWKRWTIQQLWKDKDDPSYCCLRRWMNHLL